MSKVHPINHKITDGEDKPKFLFWYDICNIHNSTYEVSSPKTNLILNLIKFHDLNIILREIGGM